MTGVSADTDLQPILTNREHGKLHGVVLHWRNTLTCTGGRVAPSWRHHCRHTRNTPQLAHNYKLSASQSLLFFVSVPPTLHAQRTAAPPTRQQTCNNKQIAGEKDPGASSCAFFSGFPATSLLFIFCLKCAVPKIVEFFSSESCASFSVGWILLQTYL